MAPEDLPMVPVVMAHRMRRLAVKRRALRARTSPRRSVAIMGPILRPTGNALWANSPRVAYVLS